MEQQTSRNGSTRKHWQTFTIGLLVILTVLATVFLIFTRFQDAAEEESPPPNSPLGTRGDNVAEPLVPTTDSP